MIASIVLILHNYLLALMIAMLLMIVFIIYNCSYLKPPLLHIDAKQKIPDLLHINLRITAGLYWYTAQRHCGNSEDSLVALREWMKSDMGITVNSKKRQTKKQDSVAIGQKKESFIGEECVKLVGNYEHLLEHIKKTYKTVSQADEDKAQAAWELWRRLWTLLLKPVEHVEEGTTSLPPMHLRVARAQEVKQLAQQFVTSFVNAAGENDAATVYCHILQCHVPDYITWYGDLLNYGCHGSEHVHSVTKDAFKRGTSKHHATRVGQVFKHMKVQTHHAGEAITPERKKRGPKREVPAATD